MGVVCGSCAAGYVKSDIGCTPCDGSGSGASAVMKYVVISICVLVALVILAVYVWWHFLGGQLAEVVYVSHGGALA